MMIKKVLLVLVGFILIGFMYLMGIRSEFKDHLTERYPNHKFSVGFVGVDPLYEKFYAKATSLEDYVSFPISMEVTSKTIYEDYPQVKSQIQYNTQIQNLFDQSSISSSIKGVTGSSETLYTGDGHFSQINLYLEDNCDITSIAKKSLTHLIDNNVTFNVLILTQEKDKQVFELYLSMKDQVLTEDELRSKVRMIKG